MSFTDRQLGRAGLKAVTRAVKAAEGWTLTTTQVVGGTIPVAVAPDNATRIPFGVRSGYGTIVAQFRQAGLDVDPRRQRRDMRGRPVSGHAPFASVADILDDVEQKPLIDVPESVTRTWTFSDHALSRCADRNIGVFEVWAALHAPDHVIDDPTGRIVKHHLRGDVEVVVGGTGSILTVIDILEHRRTTPRVALAPGVRRDDSAHIAEEATMPKPEFDVKAYVSKAAAIRALILQRDIGEKFTPRDISALLPTGWHNSVSITMFELTRKYALVRHEEDGTYEILDKKPIEAIQDRPPTRTRRGATTAHDAVTKYLRMLHIGQEFTYADAHQAVGSRWTMESVRSQIRRAVTLGVIHLARIENGGHVYAKGKAPKGAPVPAAPVVVAPIVEDTEDDVDVSLGFAFERLPASDVYDLIDQVNTHRSDLEAAPGQWARIATYHGPRILDKVSQRAGKLESLMDDPHLRFMVRRIGELDAGLFVSWVAKVGA